jgi:hypothetical protein
LEQYKNLNFPTVVADSAGGGGEAGGGGGLVTLMNFVFGATGALEAEFASVLLLRVSRTNFSGNSGSLRLANFARNWPSWSFLLTRYFFKSFNISVLLFEESSPTFLHNALILS